MPTYVFVCPKCKQTLEINRSVKNESPVICCEDDCGVEMYQKIVSTSFILSGKCWAKDGYSG